MGSASLVITRRKTFSDSHMSSYMFRIIFPVAEKISGDSDLEPQGGANNYFNESQGSPLLTRGDESFLQPLSQERWRAAV